MSKKVLIIGGGVAGLEASGVLSKLGFFVTIVEASDHVGGKLNRWANLFPSRRPASDVLNHLKYQLDPNTTIITNSKIYDININKSTVSASLSGGENIEADAVLISTGFELFDARKKEEYGYKIYENVITSADLEKIIKEGNGIKTSRGKTPQRIGIVHCVGSRDEKAGNTYCSKVCCVTGVKQAIELKEQLPSSEIFNFYMDLRMYDRYFEDLYKEAQVKHHVQFIRGRLSEAFENPDGTVMIKIEDTLLGKPMKMNLDLLVLLIGMTGTSVLKEKLGLHTASDGFYLPVDEHLYSTSSNQQGIFYAGACTGPKQLKTLLQRPEPQRWKLQDT
ncbi:MAG: CoB--CoM heterodisulfide reductase iron-sulfur subunit A family protein [Bacteroidales bacterium]|nr:CoB--CoM heterodisulfide reductase iron-sulfur subunit A family protein [Bacteroidales bacterium]